MMEMPTPCQGCGEVVEFNDLRVCITCGELYCRDCLTKGECDRCRHEEFAHD